MSFCWRSKRMSEDDAEEEEEAEELPRPSGLRLDEEEEEEECRGILPFLLGAHGRAAAHAG
jgi:hypothetical protein